MTVLPIMFIKRGPYIIDQWQVHRKGPAVKVLRHTQFCRNGMINHLGSFFNPVLLLHSSTEMPEGSKVRLGERLVAGHAGDAGWYLGHQPRPGKRLFILLCRINMKACTFYLINCRSNHFREFLYGLGFNKDAARFFRAVLFGYLFDEFSFIHYQFTIVVQIKPYLLTMAVKF